MVRLRVAGFLAPTPTPWRHQTCHDCAKHSATGTRTRVARVRAEYPNQLDYSGVAGCRLSVLEVCVVWWCWSLPAWSNAKAPPSNFLMDALDLATSASTERRVRHPSRVFSYVGGGVTAVVCSWRMCVRACVRTHTHTRTHRHTHTHTDTRRHALRNTRPRQERKRTTQHGHNPPSLFQPKTATLKDIAIAPMTTTLARCLAELLR